MFRIDADVVKKILTMAILLVCMSSPISIFCQTTPLDSDGNKTLSLFGRALPGLRVCVSKADADDIPAVLDSLGVPYQMSGEQPAPLYNCDVVLIGCNRKQIYDREQIRNFVTAGGVVYVGCISCPTLLQSAFPEKLPLWNIGTPGGIVRFDVQEPLLVKSLGKAFEINLNSGFSYAYPLRVSKDVSVLVVFDDSRRRFPMAAGFKHGKGKVMFSSFHSDGRTPKKEQMVSREIIKYVLLSAQKIQEAKK